MEQDFLDEMIEESTKKNPEFPSLMEEARQRRLLLKELAAMRVHAHISQQTVAKRVRTSQPAIARLRLGLSTLAYQPYSAMHQALGSVWSGRWSMHNSLASLTLSGRFM